MLKGKKILLGVTASIAAYKAILLVRELVKEGAEVKVIITEAAKDFVSPLTLATLSKNAVLSSIATNYEWANHVMLGRWADVMIVAPLSCNTLAKMANGSCDNLLMAVYLSATCPVLVSPAMDEDMWYHPSVKRNVEIIKSYGNHVMNVESGELASGLIGEGRMAEPESIVQYLKETFFRSHELSGKKAFVSAGPTYEALDPVRFIGNRSSGKMGFALATVLYEKGAEVWLITGPTKQVTAYQGIHIIHVETAAQMLDACIQLHNDMNIEIMSAAVADYRPKHKALEKIKKNDNIIIPELEKTTDILLCLGKNKQLQKLVGFALETENELDNAQKKLHQKNADMIVLNSLRNDKAGFDYDTNKVSLLLKNGEIIDLPLASKKEIALQIVDTIIQKL